MYLSIGRPSWSISQHMGFVCLTFFSTSAREKLLWNVKYLYFRFDSIKSFRKNRLKLT
jgi:hypothetical protein